jgi:hypothetical protein
MHRPSDVVAFQLAPGSLPTARWLRHGAPLATNRLSRWTGYPRRPTPPEPSQPTCRLSLRPVYLPHGPQYAWSRGVLNPVHVVEPIHLRCLHITVCIKARFCQQPLETVANFAAICCHCRWHIKAVFIMKRARARHKLDCKAASQAVFRSAVHNLSCLP